MGGATGDLQQAKAAVAEHRKVSDMFRTWEERIHKQAQHFEAIASQVLQFDTEIIANASKVKELRTEHAILKSRQDVVEQSIQQMFEQQDSLSQLLTGLEGALRGKVPDEVGTGAPAPPRTHERAKVLSVQLDEVDRQAEDLARETETVQSRLYAEPLATVVRVLDAHASALDSIEGQVSSVQQRVRAVEATL